MIGAQGTTAVPAGTFAPANDGAMWKFAGTLTMDGAAAALQSANVLPLPSTGVVDFSGMLQADSSALAVIIALKRRASVERRSLTLAGLPASLMSLAVVYGVDGLIAA